MKTRVFFATDIHGSESCFKKFVMAGKFYKAQVTIMGGDITGKAIVPVVEEKDGTYTTKYLGKSFEFSSKQQLETLEKEIRNTGYYVYHCSQEEKEDLEKDPIKLDKLFSEVMTKSVRDWLQYAGEKLKGSGIKCYIMPGNDDRLDIDPVFETVTYVVNPEGKVIKIDEQHEMISTGYSNITPWSCPRDIPEEELAERLESMTSQVNNMKSCIFNFHCPPYESGLDLAPKLDASLKIETRGGRPEMQYVGSKVIRTAIEKFQPLLGLHGHIHESKGFTRIGRTLCLNPGSEYLEGVLRGALVDLEKDKFVDYVLTSG